MLFVSMKAENNNMTTRTKKRTQPIKMHRAGKVKHESLSSLFVCLGEEEDVQVVLFSQLLSSLNEHLR